MPEQFVPPLGPGWREGLKLQLPVWPLSLEMKKCFPVCEHLQGNSRKVPEPSGRQLTPTPAVFLWVRTAARTQSEWREPCFLTNPFAIPMTWCYSPNTAFYVCMYGCTVQNQIKRSPLLKTY